MLSYITLGINNSQRIVDFMTRF